MSTAGGGKQTFNIFGSDSGSDAPAASRGIATRPNSGTHKPSNNSPFSKEAAPELKRRTSRVHEISSSSPFHPSVDTSSPASSGSGISPSPSSATAEKRTPKANVPSADFPLSGDPARPTTAQRKERDYKANQVSKNNTLAATADSDSSSKPVTSPERLPKANKVSSDSPFNPTPVDKPRKSSLVARPTPGAKNFNVVTGEGASEAAKETRKTATFGYSDQSPFNPKPTPPPVQRTPSRSHEISNASPFSNAEYVAPKVNRATPKANTPDDNSPWSKKETTPKARPASKINSSSADSPFAPNAESSSKPVRNTNRVAPGGNQTYNILEHNQ